MSDCAPDSRIGTPLRLAYAAALRGPLPAEVSELLRTIDGRMSLHSFARELTAVMPRLRSYARSLTRNADAAEDLVQDTLLKAWRARDQFASGTSLRAWTCTILRNVFLSQRRRARLDDDYDPRIAEIRLAHPETQSSAIELDDVWRAMEKLGPDQREALRLVSTEGLSYEDAAHRLGISLASFKSRVSRGRRMLQSIIDGNAPQLRPAEMAQRSDARLPSPRVKPTEKQGDRHAGIRAGHGIWIG